MATGDGKNLLKCKICTAIFDSPILLPCGETVCKKHLNQVDLFEIVDDRFECLFCGEEHKIPSNGFPYNKALEQLVQYNLDQIELGDAYKGAKISFENFNLKIETLEKIKIDPGGYINEHFSDIMDEIDARRIKLKSELDYYYDNLIQHLRLHLNQCLVMLKSNKTVENNNLNYFKASREAFEKELKYLPTISDENKWKSIELNAKILCNSIDFKINELKNSLLLNNAYEFKKADLVVNPKMFGDLVITTNKNHIDHKEILELNKRLMSNMQHNKLEHNLTPAARIFHSASLSSIPNDKSLETFKELNKIEIVEFNKRLLDKKITKYRLVDYERIESWENLSRNQRENFENHLNKFSENFRKSLNNYEQNRHLKIILDIEKMNPVKTIKNYVIITNCEYRVGLVPIHIYKVLNPGFKAEFLNDFRFVLFIKNPKAMEVKI